MPVAVGTSLLVIAMKSFAGLAGYLSTVPINWGLVAAVTVAAVVGSLLGGRLAGRIPADALRKAFGWFVLVMGAFVLAQQASGGRAAPALRCSPWPRAGHLLGVRSESGPPPPSTPPLPAAPRGRA